MEVQKPDYSDSASIPNIPCKVSEFGRYSIPTRCEMNDFWNGCREWFTQRGIYLYDLCHPDPANAQWEAKYWLCPPASSSAPLPYGVLMEPSNFAPRYIFSLIRLACAQDSMNRNLMLKLVDKGSAEHQIYLRIGQKLLSCTFDDTATFPCVLPPVAILDTPHDYAIVVMPMWGSPVNLEDLQTVGEVLRCMQCLLRGMTFLHQLRVAHRDICNLNMVINCHSPGVASQEFREVQRQHHERDGDRVIYALMDYDQSLHLPEGTSLDRCRRPTAEAAAGAATHKPSDIHLGEPYYNPFAYDVGMLGMLFRYYFAEVVPHLPGLAALFDRMTDHSVKRRLTAEAAGAFLSDLTEALPPATLKATVALEPSWEAMRNADLYWGRLSREDQHLWGMYRTPPRPLWEKILDWITLRPMGWEIVHCVRRVLQV